MSTAAPPPVSVPRRAVAPRWRLSAPSRAVAYIVFFAVYAPVTLALAHRKLLWDDEFFTLYLSTTESWSALTRALSTGADQHPASFYWLTHAILSTLGPSNIAFRLTAIAGYAVFCLCLYEIARRLLGREWAPCAMLLPLASPHYYYAIESRGYGLQLGFAGAAFLLWMLAADGRRRFATLPLLALSLAGAVGSHYYAALLLAPLAAGELVRALSLRRVDWPVWLAFGGAALPILAFAPLLSGAWRYSAHFWAKPQWRDVVNWYPEALGYTIALPLLISIVAIFRRGGVPAPRLRPWHAAALIALALLPAVTLVFAKSVTHAYTNRYALAALGGVAILLVAGLARVARAIPWAPAAVALALLLCFGVTAMRLRNVQRAELAGLRQTAALLRAAGGGPIVVSDPMTLHKLSFYARRDLAHRVTYLSDPRAAVRHQGFDTIDRGLLDLNPWFPLNVRRLDEWLPRHPSFTMWGYTGPWGWLHSELVERGADLRIAAIRDDYLLLRVAGVKLLPDTREPGDPSGYPMLYDRMPKQGPPLCRQYLPAASCPEID